TKRAKLGLDISVLGSVVIAAASLLAGGRATGDSTTANTGGTQALYGNIPPDQIEFLSTGDRIKSVAASGSMMAIWETLEHGEKVECVDCIPSVEPLLYDANPRTREIAAWWLRRRIFGVWGPGEVYQRTTDTLANDPDPKRRANAAYALGEFLAQPGVDACSAAINRDGDPTVRAAAASALGRLNDPGNGALSQALADVDARVKLAALTSAGRINTFVDKTAVAKLVSDGDPNVRRRSIEILGAMRANDAVDGIIAIAQNDPDPNVRNAACHTLGALHDPKARAILQAISTTDSNQLVRDQAAIALRRL
ncbi:MAG TPA: HEAT repeat domain-containing protein, partial [Labilithrix sp.]